LALCSDKPQLREVFGRNLGAGLKAVAGGEVDQFTSMIFEARVSALERMIMECSKRHRNAVIAMRFDLGTLGETLSEACAYGTSCIIEQEGHSLGMQDI
jgi:uncharacterized protein YbjQ (UPF0145 family)